MDDKIASGGSEVSHFGCKAGSLDVLSSASGRLMMLGSSLLMPWTAATAFRSARRESQVLAVTVASLKSGLSALCSFQKQPSSFGLNDVK